MKRPDARLAIAWLIFPKDFATQSRGWSRPPKVDLLPDRFVLVTTTGGVRNTPIVGNPIHSPLEAGLDPTAPTDEQMQRDADGNLVVPEPMKWMTDFDRAVEWGMGFRVPLTSEQAEQGFDRLVVVGLRLQDSAQEGKRLFSNLWLHHHFGRSGIAIVPQGTPTNNTEGRSSGHSRVDDPDASFKRLFGSNTDVPFSADPFAKSDGQCLTEMLGLDPFEPGVIPGGDGRDQAEAKAMNRVLMPATLSTRAVRCAHLHTSQPVSAEGQHPALDSPFSCRNTSPRNDGHQGHRSPGSSQCRRWSQVGRACPHDDEGVSVRTVVAAGIDTRCFGGDQSRGPSFGE